MELTRSNTLDAQRGRRMTGSASQAMDVVFGLLLGDKIVGRGSRGREGLGVRPRREAGRDPRELSGPAGRGGLLAVCRGRGVFTRGAKRVLVRGHAAFELHGGDRDPSFGLRSVGKRGPKPVPPDRCSAVTLRDNPSSGNRRSRRLFVVCWANPSCRQDLPWPGVPEPPLATRAPREARI